MTTRAPESTRAIFFDIGGVVIHDTGLKESLLRVFSSAPQDAVWTALNKEVLPACRGGAPLVDCWRNLAVQFGLSPADERLERLWIDDFRDGIRVNSEIVALAKRLRAEGYELGVISNTIHEHALILRELGVYDPFDHVVLSHEVKLTKDSPAIFHWALGQAKASASESIFIDDVAQFAATAEQIGMKAIVYTDVPALLSALRELGVRGA